MGRSIFVDETVQTYIEQLIKANKWFTGVIIGQVTQQRDYVVHIVRTPDPVEDEASEEIDDNEPAESQSKQNLIRPSSLEQLDDKWVSTHAKQVCRMLPGGLSVIGLFALAPTSMLQACQVKLKQMMFSVHKSLTKNPLLVSPNEITDRILLQIDSKTRKLTCSSLDVADGKNSPRPAEWKYQSASSRWTRLDSQISVDIPMAVPGDNKTQPSLLRQLQGGLSTFCESVRQAVTCIDGVIREGSEPLISQQTERKGGKGGKGKGDNNDNVISKVNIFLPFSCATPQEDNPQVSKSVDTFRVCGTITIRAFVPAKASVSDAVEAVKTDIVRSLYARCELLCEEDDVTEDKEDSSVYSPPVRYFYSSPNDSISFCDYAFQDEKQDEMAERIQELLDIGVEELENVETHATEDDTLTYLSSAVENSPNIIPSYTDHHQAAPSGCLIAYIGAAVGGLVAIVASGLSYMYLSE